MKKIICTLLLIAPLSVFAGKEEREYMKSDVNPVFKEAQDAMKKSCGCALKMSVDESSLKTVDELRQAKYTAESVRDGAEKFCTDAESKKAVCKMKSLQVKKGKEAKFAFASGNGQAITDGQSYCSFDMMTKELDK